MPSVNRIARRISERAFGTAFDRALARARREARPSFLFCWNRGLGDIALGLVPLFGRIRQTASAAHIAVITRDELRSAFELTRADQILVLPGLQRGTWINPAIACAALGVDREAFGCVFDDPDPTHWLDGRCREFPPALSWNPAWDAHAGRFLAALPRQTAIAAHVHTETARYYGYVRDWPASAWQELFARFRPADRVQWVLLGYAAEPRYEGANITDLRGRTGLAELLSVIKNRCRLLIAPDGGVLTMTYYLDVPFAIDVISLWSDPRQGILRQGCASPNPLLRHVPLVGVGENIGNVSIASVAAAVEAVLARSAGGEERGVPSP